MKMNYRNISKITVAIASIFVLGSCGSDPDSAGLEYMPDMYRSPAIEPYVDYGHIKERENKDFKMTLSAMTPPSGTIPFVGTDSADVALMMPYHRKPMKAMESTHGLYGYEYSDQDEYTLAAADVNPLKINADNSEEIFAAGKKIFESKCAHCHGKKGDGNGTMVESGAYVGVPDYKNVSNLGDGQLFYSIYYGKGAMGAHNSILNKKEIWTLVHYIRKFQNADYPAAASAVASEEEAGEEDNI